MTLLHTYLDSPIGPITLVQRDGLLSGLFMEAQAHRPDEARFGTYDPTPFAPVVEQLEQYFAGDRDHFDVELAPVGSAFQLQVWQALRNIPHGETATYGQIAERVGRPGAARAVGTINARNPISIIVPCHRVIGSNGKLSGYNGGVERKQFLLELERRQLP